MPMWAYKGVDPRGKAVTGVKDADSPKALRSLLRRDGVLVTDVAEARARQGGGRRRRGASGLRREVDLEAGSSQTVKTAEVAGFTRQLGDAAQGRHAARRVAGRARRPDRATRS